MKEDKEEFYDKANPIVNQIIGRLAISRNISQSASEAHELAIKLGNLLDDWINEE